MVAKFTSHYNSSKPLISKPLQQDKFIYKGKNKVLHVIKESVPCLVCKNT